MAPWIPGDRFFTPLRLLAPLLLCLCGSLPEFVTPRSLGGRLLAALGLLLLGLPTLLLFGGRAAAGNLRGVVHRRRLRARHRGKSSGRFFRARGGRRGVRFALRGAGALLPLRSAPALRATSDLLHGKRIGLVVATTTAKTKRFPLSLLGGVLFLLAAGLRPRRLGVGPPA